MPERIDETWHRLLIWTHGQAPSERLAAQVAMSEGYTSVDPSHPLGGPDGGADALMRRGGELWVLAAYFPRGQQTFGAIKSKLLSDSAGVARNGAHGLAFVTNQELTRGERDDLAAAVPHPVDLFHLERLSLVLDRPAMAGVRQRFLQIDAVSSAPAFVRALSGYEVTDHWTGRHDEERAIRDFLGLYEGAANTCVVSAAGGMGKSALCLRVANAAVAAGGFPGGAVFADFRGYAPDPGAQVTPERAYAALIRALGELPEPDPDLLAVQYHRLLTSAAASEARILLIFDNVSSAGQVAELLPAGPHRAIVTSRHRLGPLLGAASQLQLEPLLPEEALELLRSTARPSPGSAGRTDSEVEQLEALRDLCGGMPLAVRIVGALLQTAGPQSAAAVHGELAEERGRLTAMEYEDSSVRIALGGSYARLPGQTAACFRRIALLPPGAFSADALSCATGDSISTTRRDIRRLVVAHLVDATVGDRYLVHDLVRLYARDRVDAEDEAAAIESAIDRLDEYYVDRSDNAIRWINNATEHSTFPDPASALEWLAMETAAIVASASRALSRGAWQTAWHLTANASLYLSVSGDNGTGLAASKMGLAAAEELADDLKIAGALNNQALTLCSLQRYSEARPLFARAARHCRLAGDKEEEAVMLTGLGEAFRDDGMVAASELPLMRARTLAIEAEAWGTLGFALTNLGITYRLGGKFEPAIDYLHQALRIHRTTGASRASASTLAQLGTAYMQVGNASASRPLLVEAGDVFASLGDRGGQGSAVMNLGNLERMCHRPDRARELYVAALDLFTMAGREDLEQQAQTNLRRLEEAERGAG